MFPYHGLVRGPIPLQFSSTVSIPLTCIKVVDHGEPLLLLGADVLRGGRPGHYWCFESIGMREVATPKPRGFMTFVKQGS